MPHDIVVSIINYRTAALTMQCARSVLDDRGSLDVQIVIVDNASADDSVPELRAWIDTLPAAEQAAMTFVESETNSGFSGGHNQGFAGAPGDFYLVLNSDAVLEPGFLATMLEAARAQPEYGFFAPRIGYDDGGTQDSCFRFPSPLSELERSARTGFVTRLLRGHMVSLGPAPDISQIEWASFACILLRGEMITNIGPMDEGYFLYFEDIEYCLRAHRKGWRIAYVPTASAIHFRGGSGPVKTLNAERAELPRYYYSSRTRFFYQAHGRFGLFAANLLWYLGRTIKHSTRLLGRDPGQMPLAEGRNIWVNAGDPLGPRYAPWEHS